MKHSYRNLTSIKDVEIKNFIESLDSSKFLYDKTLIKKFKKNFIEWLKKSKLNDFSYIDKFDKVSITNGSVHAFDHFYLKNKDKVFRMCDGEFMYHSVVLKKNYFSIDIMNNNLNSNDVFLISVPFTKTGKVHENLEKWLYICEKNNVNVLLDFCHAPCSKNILIDFSKFECVKNLSFSVSKPFWGAENLRIGVRFEKSDYYTDDGIDVLNDDSIEMVNLIGIGIANELINRYEFDFNWNKYGDFYSKICEKLNLQQTDNILFGIGGDEYKSYDRAGVNRICLSEEISEMCNAQ